MAARVHSILLAMVLTVVGLVGVSFAAAGPASAGGDRDCGDFATQAAAQQFFLSQGGPQSDPHGLDSEGDGVACESKPCPCSSSQGGGNNPGPGHNPPPPRPKYTVDFNVQDLTPTLEKPVRISGRVRPAAPNAVVILQAKSGGSGWVDAVRFRLNNKSSLRARMVINRAGRYSLRLVKKETAGQAGNQPGDHGEGVGGSTSNRDVRSC